MLNQQMVVSFCKQVLHKLADIEVISDKIIYLCNLAIGDLCFDISITLQALYGFTPYFSRQRIVLRCTLIPMAAALQ